MTQVSLITRARVWVDSLPLFTRGVLFLMAGVYLVGVLTGLNSLGPVCLSAYQTTTHFQVYRLVTSAIVHVGLMHVAFNLMTFIPMGASLERILGTLQFSWMVLLLMLLEGVLYIVLSAVLTFTRIYPDAMYQCAAGFSGVIFGLIVIESASNTAPTRSLFGAFEVPAAVYPWALLLILQLLPGVSFLSHLCGLLVGYAYVSGYLKWFLPSRQLLLSVEGSDLAMRFLTRHPSFMMVPGPSLPVSFSSPTHTRSPGWAGAGGGGDGREGSLGGSLGSWTQMLQWTRRPHEAGAQDGDEEEGPALLTGRQAGASSDSKFQGRGHQLGGSSARAQQQAAAAAAAAAAEARVATLSVGAAASPQPPSTASHAAAS